MPTPTRLDLADMPVPNGERRRRARQHQFHAHSTVDFAYLHYGVGQARRGWLATDDVLNTRPLAALRRLLKAAH